VLQASFPVEAPPAGWALGCIDSLVGMDRIRDEWQALERRAADSLSYFQSYDWCRTWCAHYATSARSTGPQIRIYTCRLGGRLVMVWPLMLIGDRRPLKTVVALAEPHGQYGNILIDPVVWSAGLAADLVESCWRLVDSAERADAIMLDSVPDGALPRRLYASGEVMAEPAGLNSAMDLTRFDGCYEAYRANLKSTTRRARNKRRNKLAAQGALDYRVHFGGTPEYAELVRIGIAMKREWLERTGRATRALNLPEVPEFLGALPNSPEGDNGAVAAALTLDGRPVAAEIGFRYQRRFYSYLGAFDWELRDFSPGKLQLDEALKWCLTNGIEVYDLLSDPSAYKSDWCNVATPLTTYRRASTLTGKAYLGLWCDNLRPALKRTFEQMPLGLRSRLTPLAEGRTHTAQALSWK
jgi:CelD/BcsL family acetyltransferase involved in cellulose biosynthesis